MSRSRTAGAASGRRRSAGRQIGFALFYVLYLVAFLLVVHYFFFWRPFVRTLHETQRPKEIAPGTARYVDADVIRHLGFVRPNKRSSFVRFAQTKPPGVIRVCALGDSFTHGDEVDDSHDYPSLLQQLFDQRCHGRIEVINFGTGWHGFHQTYIMWDRVARRFSCDYVLLGPRTFLTDRDTAFQHTDFVAPYYLHSRYILDGDDVALVEVLGNTHAERFDHYYRFFPHWRYLRYDRNAPPVVRAALPRDRTVPNPFYYYHGSRDEEAFATYRVLLRHLADDGAHIVLLHQREGLLELADGIGKPNLVAEKEYQPKGFPYRAPRDHYSAWGNQIIAEELYAHLVGTRRPLTVLESEDMQLEARAESAADKPPLSSYDRIDVRLGPLPVGFFVASKRPGQGDFGWESALRKTSIVSLLAIKDPGSRFVDAGFVPLDFALQPGMQVTLQVHRLWQTAVYALGTVRLISPGLNIGVVDVEGVKFVEQKKLVFAGNAGAPLPALTKLGATLTLRVGDRAAMDGGRGEEGVELLPTSREFRLLRAGQFPTVDVNTLPVSGDFSLVLQHPRFGTTRVLIARWKQETADVPPERRPLTGPLSAAGMCH